jgi:hypothetical protein
MAITSDLRGRIQVAARQLLEEKWAVEGQPSLLEKRFIEIEDEACEVADALAEEMMRLIAAQQADVVSSSGDACCPSCSREVHSADIEPRNLQTRRGEVGWQEPRYYCGRCRKNFFPSVPPAGDRAG